MRASFLVGLAVLAVACGGKVELSSGGGGGGGTTTSSTSTSSTNTSSTVAPPTGTPNQGQISQLCAAICADAPKEDCELFGPNCAEECAAGYVEAGECGSSYLAVLTCLKDEIAKICNGMPACHAELDAFEKCDASTPGQPPKPGQPPTPGQPPPPPSACDPSTSCSGWAEGDSGASGCDCSVECQGETFRAVCESASGDSASCECYRGDNLVAKCEEPGSGTCGVTTGCCAEAFFHYEPK